MITAKLGTVSHGTMRPEDLIPDFCWELRYLGHRSSELTAIEKRSNKPEYYDTEEAMWDLETLFNMLDEHSPDGAYFGSHPGDGSDYGFWVDESIEWDFDGLKVNDLADVPRGYRGYVLVVNDHGNMTLYTKTARKLIEHWAVV